MTYAERLRAATEAAATLWAFDFSRDKIIADLKKSRIKPADIKHIEYRMDLREERGVAEMMWRMGWSDDDIFDHLRASGIRPADAARIVDAFVSADGGVYGWNFYATRGGRR